MQKFKSAASYDYFKNINFKELNTPAVLELVPRCHLGPRTRKIEIWHPELVKLCHLDP